MIKKLLATITLLTVIGLSSSAQAEEPARQADIIYIYRTGLTKTELAKAIRQDTANQQIVLFKDRNQRADDYVALVPVKPGSGTVTDGWQKCSNLLPTASHHARVFRLRSTLTLGRPSLALDDNSFVVIEHLDAYPAQRDLNPPIFVQLQQTLESLPGFQGLQIWTWTARTNHWTVITAWQSREAFQRANQMAAVEQLWDRLYENSAAPQNDNDFSLVR